MIDPPRMFEALERLQVVFRDAVGVELTDADLAELVSVDAEECQILLGVLQTAQAIERPRARVFVCPPTSWLTSPGVSP